jgi:NAD(P)-dependent dehydrogenase (short-subunit alcohol dehydrogenase family)
VGAVTKTHIFDLSGKTAVVTGACGILGRHFVNGLAAHGAQVAVVDLSAEAAEALAAELVRDHGRNAIGVACDVTDRGAIVAMADRVERELGPIDILHNNAATKGNDLEAFFATLEHYSLDTWRSIMDVNLDGLFMVAQEIGARMAARGSGSIIQTSSIYGIMGPDARIYEGSHYLGRQINLPPVYSASKAAVVGLTKHLACHWGGKGVRVNTITPGGVESGQNDVFSKKYGARVPMGRMARAEEMVGALVFLASDAASYITGQNIVVDGGLSAW